MSNTSKKIVSIIGIVIGVIIIIIGFSLQNTSSYAIGKPIAFGADFYTEMYAVTKDVGRAINNAINDLIYAISWLIISLGAIDICFFVYKLVKASEVSNSHIAGTSAEETKHNFEEKAECAPQKAKVTIDGFVFNDSALQKYSGNQQHIVIPNEVTEIKNQAFFKNNYIVSVIIPESVITIQEWAFYSCKSLEKVFIPKSVTSIKNNSFYGCEALTIYAPEGSCAEMYAKKNNINFESTKVYEYNTTTNNEENICYKSRKESEEKAAQNEKCLDDDDILYDQHICLSEGELKQYIEKLLDEKSRPKELLDLYWQYKKYVYGYYPSTEVKSELEKVIKKCEENDFEGNSQLMITVSKRKLSKL